jgi:Uma2 family endonuclease
MTTAESTAQRETFRDEPFFLFENAGWELYDRLDAWAGERRGTKLTYIDGDVVIVAKSRRHNWFALRLYDVIWALASAAGIVSEDAGATTFCLREREAGAEADQSFFFGQNAVRMAGPKDFEPGTDPVPDMVVEVDAGHSINSALRAWARLGVPEIWHLDASREELQLHVLRLQADGASYVPVPGSQYLPISDAEILGLVRLAQSEDSQSWHERLPALVAGILDARNAQ